MKAIGYTSILKYEMASFLIMRENQGFKDRHRPILMSLDRHLTSHKVIEKSLTAKVVDAWIADVGDGLSARTVNGYIGYFNSFAKYLYRVHGIETFTPERARVRESYVPYIFSDIEIADIFMVADDINMTRRVTSQVQFAMLLRLLYGCGLRLGEALSLRKFDVDDISGVLLIRGAKGNRDRYVPMDSSLTSVMTSYINYLLRNKPPDAQVFESNDNRSKNKQRSNLWAYRKFRQTLSKAGIDLPKLPRRQRNICLHCLRHTFIVRSFRKQDLAGVDSFDPAASISVYVGHYDLIGTQRYLHMTAESSADIIKATTEYSIEMFPPVPVTMKKLSEKSKSTIKPKEIDINRCSKGMFPEVPH